MAAARLIVACLLQARRGAESWPGRRFGATHIEFGLAAVVLAAVRAAAARSAGGGGLAHAHLTAVLERALRRVRCAQNLDGTEPSRKVVRHGSRCARACGGQDRNLQQAHSAVSIEDDGRAEPCRPPQPRQRSNHAAHCLMSMSTATPFEAGPNTFKDNVKHLHRGQTTSHAPAEAAQ